MLIDAQHLVTAVTRWPVFRKRPEAESWLLDTMARYVAHRR
jgi:hypothetical protein